MGDFDYDFDVRYNGVAVYTQESREPQAVIEYDLSEVQYEVCQSRIYKSPFNYKRFTLLGVAKGETCVGFVSDVLDVTFAVGVWATPDRLYAYLTSNVPRENYHPTL